jgi:hypothetical protein
VVVDFPGFRFLGVSLENLPVHSKVLLHDLSQENPAADSPVAEAKYKEHIADRFQHNTLPKICLDLLKQFGELRR